LLLEVAPTLDEQNGWSPFFADARLARADIDTIVTLDDAIERATTNTDTTGLAADYLAHVGDAAALAAKAIAGVGAR
jgi:hypothetical protein